MPTHTHHRSHRARTEPHIYWIHSFIPTSPIARVRARLSILSALTDCRAHIMAHIGSPEFFDWVIWYVFFWKLNIIANLITSYRFHRSNSEWQKHWTVRAVYCGYVYHTLHVYKNGRRADSFDNGGRYWQSHRLHRHMYGRI